MFTKGALIFEMSALFLKGMLDGLKCALEHRPFLAIANKIYWKRSKLFAVVSFAPPPLLVILHWQATQTEETLRERTGWWT
jgi:hypothetical protein